MNYKFVKRVQPKKPLMESFYSGLGENKKTLKLDGDVIGYLSKELNSELMIAIKGNPKFTTAAKLKLIKAIQGQTILPAYSSSTWLGDIIDTFSFIFRSLTGIYIGFYDGKRIVLMIANLRGLTGEINDEELYNILVHEHQHKFAGERSSYAQSNVVKNVLENWYSCFIDDYFGKIDKKHKDRLIAYWVDIKSEYKSNINVFLNTRERTMKKMFADMLQENPGMAYRLEMLYNYISDCYNEVMPSFNAPYNSGYNAYQKIGIKCDTWIFQEFVVPSEVMSVAASNNTLIGNKLVAQYL